MRLWLCFLLFFSIYQKYAQMKQKLNLGMNYHEFLLSKKFNSNYSNRLFVIQTANPFNAEWSTFHSWRLLNLSLSLWIWFPSNISRASANGLNHRLMFLLKLNSVTSEWISTHNFSFVIFSVSLLFYISWVQKCTYLTHSNFQTFTARFRAMCIKSTLVKSFKSK